MFLFFSDIYDWQRDECQLGSVAQETFSSPKYSRPLRTTSSGSCATATSIDSPSPLPISSTQQRQPPASTTSKKRQMNYPASGSSSSDKHAKKGKITF